jgi:ferritin-like metal-binding protein YciE
MATKKSSAKKTSASRAPKKAASASSSQEDNQGQLLEFFIEELRDIYWAEKHLVKALPKFQKAASSEELGNAFADHLAVTEEHVARLEEVFELLGEKARAKKCDAMEGLVSEGQSIIEDTEDGSSTRDVALIIGAQKIEHYEIATYGGLTTLAKTLGKEDVANILAETLEEEKEADELLTQLAENNINMSAASESEEGEEEEEMQSKQ